LTGKLTAKRVAKLLSKGKPGNFHDGVGLRLEIRSANSASWVSRYELNGAEHWMGLGPVRAFTLAEARERNRTLVRQRLADGIDPLDERRATKAAARAVAAKVVTFSEAAESYIASNAAKWRNAMHARQWTATLRTYVHPILGSLPVSTIDVPLVLKSSGATHRDRARRQFLEDPDRNCESRPWSYRNGLGLGHRARASLRRQSGFVENDRQGFAAALRQGRRASLRLAICRSPGLHVRAYQV
jgi:hypothetical protein